MEDGRTATISLSGPVDAIAEFVAVALERGAALTIELVTVEPLVAAENGSARRTTTAAKAKRAGVPRAGLSRTLLYDIADPQIEAGTAGTVISATRRGRGHIVAMQFGRETAEVPASWLAS